MTSDKDREKIELLRTTTDLLIEKFGEVMIVVRGDEDAAIGLLVKAITESGELTIPELAAMVAFMTRRLWYHQSRLARSYN